MEHIVIIENGIADITAARHIRKLSDKRITFISGEAAHFFSCTTLESSFDNFNQNQELISLKYIFQTQKF